MQTDITCEWVTLHLVSNGFLCKAMQTDITCEWVTLHLVSNGFLCKAMQTDITYDWVTLHLVPNGFLSPRAYTECLILLVSGKPRARTLQLTDNLQPAVLGCILKDVQSTNLRLL